MEDKKKIRKEKAIKKKCGRGSLINYFHMN